MFGMTFIFFKAGKSRDGYFGSKEILLQAERAMEILAKYYPNDDHVLIYDNARTHSARRAEALSARKIPRGWSVSESLLQRTYIGFSDTVHGHLHLATTTERKQ